MLLVSHIFIQASSKAFFFIADVRVELYIPYEISAFSFTTVILFFKFSLLSNILNNSSLLNDLIPDAFKTSKLSSVSSVSSDKCSIEHLLNKHIIIININANTNGNNVIYYNILNDILYEYYQKYYANYNGPPTLSSEVLSNIKHIIDTSSDKILFNVKPTNLSKLIYLREYYDTIKQHINKYNGGKSKGGKSKKLKEKIISGKKRTIYIGPKGGKYYIIKSLKRYIK
jgi:hypothetical protein